MWFYIFISVKFSFKLHTSKIQTVELVRSRAKKILEWCPAGRRRKGRSQNSWMQKVTTGMRKKGINNMQWIDREEWRRKIKL